MQRNPGRGLPWLLRVVLGLWALLFMVGLMVLGLVAGAGLLLWTLLRGRRPAVHFRGAGMRWETFRRPAGNPATVAPGDVVEGQAREISRPVRHVDER